MSIEIIQQQIERFLANEAPEVMSIMGSWGVGKTYAWNKYLVNAKNQRKIALSKYSYVSLFGVNSLDDLKFSIFENTVERKLIGRRPTVESFKTNTSELLKTFGKKSLSLGPAPALLDHYHSMIDSLSYLSLGKAIICIDDFERKSKNIDAQDILGLISQLKEQKRCKVVLILNDENLCEGSSIDYVKLREKVIDTELRFTPTATDCIQIALSDDRIGRLLGGNIAKLQINNIRIIKKIEKLAALLAPLLKDYDEQVFARALHSLTLLTWCYYSQSTEVPEYRFVLNRTSAFGDLDNELPLTTRQQGWSAILRRYDNYAVDDFDLQVAQLVENGYVNEASLQEAATAMHEKVLAARSEDSFQEAWRKFNESFEDNTQDVIRCLSESFQNNAKYISPANLDGTVRLLRYLGKNQMATRIIDLYIEKRQQDLELFCLDRPGARGQLKDSEVIAKFSNKRQSLRIRRSLQEVCEQLMQGEKVADDEEAQLSQASIEEFVQLFTAQKGQKLSEVVDLCLQFSRRGEASEEQKRISDKAAEALKIIGRQSKLNASRVRRFGISDDF